MTEVVQASFQHCELLLKTAFRGNCLSLYPQVPSMRSCGEDYAEMVVRKILLFSSMDSAMNG